MKKLPNMRFIFFLSETQTQGGKLRASGASAAVCESQARESQRDIHAASEQASNLEP